MPSCFEQPAGGDCCLYDGAEPSVCDPLTGEYVCAGGRVFAEQCGSLRLACEPPPPTFDVLARSDGSPADYDCLGAEPTLPGGQQPMSVFGEDLVDGAVIGGLPVLLSYGMIGECGPCIGATLGEELSVYPDQLMRYRIDALDDPAYVTTTGLLGPPGRVDTVHLPLVPTAVRDGLGQQVGVGAPVSLVGEVRDCGDQLVANATIRLFAESGVGITPEAPPAVPVLAYAQAPTLFSATRTATSSAGSFAVLGLEPGMVEVIRVEAHGSLDPDSEETLIACERLEVSLDTVSVIELHPLGAGLDPCR